MRPKQAIDSPIQSTLPHDGLGDRRDRRDLGKQIEVVGNTSWPMSTKTLPVIASAAKQSCVREDVLSAGCESPPHGAIPCEAESNCVVQLWSGRGSRSDGGRRGGEQQEANA